MEWLGRLKCRATVLDASLSFVRRHVVPGDSSDFNVLLTKKSLMFLLRLNEMSGGSEKILLVSLSF